jgi:hypothetical protein
MDVFDAIQLAVTRRSGALITLSCDPVVASSASCPILLRDPADRIQLGPD